VTNREIINCRDIDDLSRKAAIVKAMSAPGESELPRREEYSTRIAGNFSWFQSHQAAVAAGVTE
jgi:hypothetical protein